MIDSAVSALTSLPAKITAGVALFALIVLGVILYGNSRYSAGKAAENAAWQAASNEAIRKSAESAEKADQAQVKRDLEYQAKVEKEKDEIDAAIANGGDPLDALFPVAGSVRR